jgi:hypothetical protein
MRLEGTRGSNCCARVPVAEGGTQQHARHRTRGEYVDDIRSISWNCFDDVMITAISNMVVSVTGSSGSSLHAAQDRVTE